MDLSGLSAARKAMRLQTDANGDPFNITPAFIIVPAELEDATNSALFSYSSMFQIDGMAWKVRIDVVVATLGWRALIKSSEM